MENDKLYNMERDLLPTVSTNSAFTLIFLIVTQNWVERGSV